MRAEPTEHSDAEVMRKADDAPASPSEIDLLTEIRDELKKRP